MQVNRCAKRNCIQTHPPRKWGDKPAYNTAQGAPPTWVLEQGGLSLSDGDTLKATIIGDTITMYQNRKQVLQNTDDVYKTGSPRMGFDAAVNATDRRQDVYNLLGLRSYSASDGLGVTSIANPTPPNYSLGKGSLNTAQIFDLNGKFIAGFNRSQSQESYIRRPF